MTMSDPVTIILSGKWDVADREEVEGTTHITLYKVNDGDDDDE